MRESIDPHTFFVHGLEFEPNSPALHSYIGREQSVLLLSLGGALSFSQEEFFSTNSAVPYSI